MSAAEQEYVAALVRQVAAETVQALKAEGLVTAQDTRPALTIRQVSERLGISQRSVKNMIDQGKLASIKVGPESGSRVVEAAAFDEYLTERRVVAKLEASKDHAVN